jgi:hypothetical protein
MEKLAEIQADREKGYMDNTSEGERVRDFVGAALVGLIMPWSFPAMLDKISRRPEQRAEERKRELADWKEGVTKGTQKQLAPAAQDAVTRLAASNLALAEADRLAATNPKNPVLQKRAAAFRAMANAEKAKAFAQFRGSLAGQETVARSENWRHLEATRGGIVGQGDPRKAAEAAGKAGAAYGADVKLEGESMTARAGAAGTVAKAETEAAKATKEAGAQIIMHGNVPFALPPYVSDKEAEKIREITDAARGYTRELDTMEKLWNEGGGEKVMSSRAFRAAAARAQNWQSLMQKQGITKEPEVNAAIEDATNFRAGAEVRAQAREFIHGTVADALVGRGAVKIDKSQVPQPYLPRQRLDGRSDD